MTSSVEHAPTASAASSESATPVDLHSAIRHALAASDEPLTVSKIRAALPTALRQTPLEECEQNPAAGDRGQQAAPVSEVSQSQDRYRDRPMPVHVAHLLSVALDERPRPGPNCAASCPPTRRSWLAVVEREIHENCTHRHPRHPARGPESRSAYGRPTPRITCGTNCSACSTAWRSWASETRQSGPPIWSSSRRRMGAHAARSRQPGKTPHESGAHAPHEAQQPANFIYGVVQPTTRAAPPPKRFLTDAALTRFKYSTRMSDAYHQSCFVSCLRPG